MLQCQISGTITDVSNGLPVENAKVSLLDPSSRDVLITNIYSDTDGIYKENIEIGPTNVSHTIQKVPQFYWISEPYPNPVSVTGSNVITIQYMTPVNQHIPPLLEVYNVLGKKVNSSIHLANGVYLYRLRFADGHFSETKKLLLTGGGQFSISLQPIFMDSKLQLREEEFPPLLGKVMSDSVEVLYVVEKSGYAYLKQSKTLFDGVYNVHDFSLVQSTEEITAVIDSLGGTVEHTGGLKVEFQEGAFDSPVTVTLSKTDLPDSLPSDLTQVSSVFSISTGGVKPQNCAILLLNLTSTHEEGTLGIYRWNWEEWQYVGGGIVNDTIFAYVRDFSTFVAGTAGSKVYRLFRFENTGPNNATVYVWTYQLLHPEWDVPITVDLGTPCFTPPYEPPVGGNLGWYPQGFYQFCAEWLDDFYGPGYRIIGGNPPHWTYSLSEYTSLIVPPTVAVNTSIAGSLDGFCPGTITQVGLPIPGITGTWSGSLPSPYGATNIKIHDGYWIFDTSVLTETYPVVLINTREQYFILLNYDGVGYIKVAWTLINDNQMSVSIFIASSAWDPHTTIEEAINDTTAEIENAIFTKADDGS